MSDVYMKTGRYTIATDAALQMPLVTPENSSTGFQKLTIQCWVLSVTQSRKQIYSQFNVAARGWRP